jgi:branched-chain amino acid transport system ATP-binding protein
VRPLLEVSKLEKTFGAVAAAREISCSVAAGEVVGIIGANGAGKTTFVNMVTGHLKPSAGRVLFDGRDITGSASRKLVRLGVARSFQVAQLFATLSAFDNLCAAAGIARSSSVAASLGLFARAPQVVTEAEAALALFGIAQYRDAIAGTLPQGVRKVLDIAMACAAAPRLILLDEPTSGVSRDERHALMERTLGALRSRGTTVLFVEHDMEVVERFAGRVLAFYEGTIIADGPPARVLAIPEVRERIAGHA